MTMIDHRRVIVYGGQTIDNGEPRPLADLFVYDQNLDVDARAERTHTLGMPPFSGVELAQAHEGGAPALPFGRGR